MTTVTGSIRTLKATALPGATLRWKYLSYPAYINGALVSSVEDVVTRADDVGDFSQALTAGDYELTIDGNTNDKWTVSVPNDNTTYDVFDLIVSDVTAIPSAPTLAAVPDATSSIKGKVRLASTPISPSSVDLYTKEQIDTLLPVNVLSYSADRTGVADSRTAFVNALAAVTTGGVLYVPRGTYSFSAAWAISKSTFRIVMEPGAKLVYSGAADIGNFIGITGDAFEISGGEIDGAGKSAITLDLSGDRWRVQGCYVHGAFADADIDPGAVTIVSNLKVEKGSTGWRITGNRIGAVTMTAAGSRSCGNILLSDFGYATSADQIRGVIDGNHIESSGGLGSNNDANGVQLSLQTTYNCGVIISDNHFYDWDRSAIKVIGSGAVITGNTFDNTNNSGARTAVRIYGDNCIVANNLVIGDFLFYALEIGTTIYATSGNVITGNKIVFTGAALTTGIPINLATGCTETRLSGNSWNGALGIVVNGTATGRIGSTYAAEDDLFLDWEGNPFPAAGWLADECFGINAMGFSSSVTGAGAAVASSNAVGTLHGGLVSIACGTTATGAANWRSAASAPWIFGSQRTHKLIQCIRTPSALSDGTDTYDLVSGWGDMATAVEPAGTDGAYFRYSHGFNSGNWAGRTALAGAFTTASGGVGNVAVAASTFYWLGIHWTGTSAKFYVAPDSNGKPGTWVHIGTSSSNLPTSNGFGIINMIVKSLGTTDRTMYVDKVFIRP